MGLAAKIAGVCDLVLDLLGAVLVVMRQPEQPWLELSELCV